MSATMDIESAAKTVQVSDLNLYYGSFLAVEDVNVTIQPNKVTALIGSSGCGKSTFLRSLNRMHELVPGAYAQGTVLVDGEERPVVQVQVRDLDGLRGALDVHRRDHERTSVQKRR